MCQVPQNNSLVSVVFLYTVLTFVQNNELVAKTYLYHRCSVEFNSTVKCNRHFPAKLVDLGVVGLSHGKQCFPVARRISTLLARASFILRV